MTGEVFCNKCGFVGAPDVLGNHDRPSGERCGYTGIPIDQCKVPPEGWRCTRAAGHEGPCAAIPLPNIGEAIETAYERLFAKPKDDDWRKTPKEAKGVAEELTRVLATREGDAKFGMYAWWHRHTIIHALEYFAASAPKQGPDHD